MEEEEREREREREILEPLQCKALCCIFRNSYRSVYIILQDFWGDLFYFIFCYFI